MLTSFLPRLRPLKYDDMLRLNVITYLLCCTAAYFFSLTYVGWYGEYLLWAVIWLPPLITLLSLPTMLAFRVRCSVPETVNLGETAELKIDFHSRRLLPLRRCSFVLRVKNIFTGEESLHSMAFSLVYNDHSFVSLPTRRSGLLLCSIENICVYSYLGLIKLRSGGPVQASCTVMPLAAAPENMASLDSLPPPSLSFRPKPGGGYAEEHELRQYRPGDSINSIHWKLSSKTDELIVREPMEPVDEGTAIMLCTAEEADLAHLYWLSLRLCESMITHSIHFGDRQVSGIANETDCRRALRALLSAPAAAAADISGSYSRVFELRNGEVHWQ